MKRKKRGFRTNILVRLWTNMMALIVLGIAFMWVAQIFLFERNYIDSAMNDVQGRLDTVMAELTTEDLALNDKPLSYLSISMNGKVMVVDDSGKLLAKYGYGHPIAIDTAEAENFIWRSMQESPQNEQVLQRQEYKNVNRNYNVTSFEIGIPVLYDGENAYVILYYSLNEVSTVLQINRRQLVTLSIVLTIVAAVVSVFLSRRFVKPIKKIKNAVESLTKGDLEATPGLSLQDELGQLSDSVEELGKALQRVDVLRREIIANVSHELRAPLSLIAGYAEMVRDINWKDDTKRNEDLNLIIREAGRMSEMVSDIMDHSQLQAGFVQLKKELYSLYDIVESEVIHCEQSAAEYKIVIRLEGERTNVSVNVDAVKISQVMRNLLYNAINHTADGETISVLIEKVQDKKIRVSVVNPGDPIPEEDREIIWERYQRSQHQGGRKTGTGIGLSIVSSFLKAHGMPYGVHCEDGLTTFWFECEWIPEP